jgi:hypothetical protein
MRGRLSALGKPVADDLFVIERRTGHGRIVHAGAVTPRKRVLDRRSSAGVDLAFRRARSCARRGARSSART